MPHKEERFLYIVYGPLALSTGITVAAIFDTFKTFSRVIKRAKIGQFIKSPQAAVFAPRGFTRRFIVDVVHSAIGIEDICINYVLRCAD